MFTQKEVTQKYEVTRNTLYNWKTTKPNIYNLLLNSDGFVDELRELKIILEKYSKTINADFLLEDIEYVLSHDLENHLEDIEKLHTLYIEKTTKDIKIKSEFVLSIYQKLQSLNIIERYIFISRIKSIKKQKVKHSELKGAIKHYFEEFLRSKT